MSSRLQRIRTSSESLLKKKLINKEDKLLENNNLIIMSDESKEDNVVHFGEGFGEDESEKPEKTSSMDGMLTSSMSTSITESFSDLTYPTLSQEKQKVKGRHFRSISIDVQNINNAILRNTSNTNNNSNTNSNNTFMFTNSVTTTTTPTTTTTTTSTPLNNNNMIIHSNNNNNNNNNSNMPNKRNSMQQPKQNLNLNLNLNSNTHNNNNNNNSNNNNNNNNGNSNSNSNSNNHNSLNSSKGSSSKATSRNSKHLSLSSSNYTYNYSTSPIYNYSSSFYINNNNNNNNNGNSSLQNNSTSTATTFNYSPGYNSNCNNNISNGNPNGNNNGGNNNNNNNNNNNSFYNFNYSSSPSSPDNRSSSGGGGGILSNNNKHHSISFSTYPNVINHSNSTNTNIIHGGNSGCGPITIELSRQTKNSNTINNSYYNTNTNTYYNNGNNNSNINNNNTYYNNNNNGNNNNNTFYNNYNYNNNNNNNTINRHHNSNINSPTSSSSQSPTSPGGIIGDDENGDGIGSNSTLTNNYNCCSSSTTHHLQQQQQHQPSSHSHSRRHHHHHHHHRCCSSSNNSCCHGGGGSCSSSEEEDDDSTTTNNSHGGVGNSSGDESSEHGMIMDDDQINTCSVDDSSDKQQSLGLTVKDNHPSLLHKYSTLDKININSRELERERVYWKEHKKHRPFYRKLIHQNSIMKSSSSFRLKENYLDINNEDTQKSQDIFQKSITSNLNLKFKDYYTEESYIRYILQKNIPDMKNYIVIGVVIILCIQFIQILFGVKNDSSKILWKLVLLDTLGVILPLGIIYYIINHLSKYHLSKYMSLISVVMMFILGPFAILVINFIITETYIYEISLITYIAIFFIGHYLLLFKFMYSLISIIIYLISWCVAISLQTRNTSSLPSSSSAAAATTDGENKETQEIVSLIVLKIFIFVCISVVMAFAMYMKELLSRKQFMSEQRLFRINSKLVSQLNRIEKGFANEAADLDAPIEKAIITVRSLMASPTIGPEHLKALDLVLTYLQLPNLFTPDLDQQVTQGLKMDDERKKWLFSEVAHRKQIERSKRSSSSESSSIAGSYSPFYTQTPSPHDYQSEMQIINIDNYLTNYSTEILKKIDDYNFPMFEFFRSTQRPLLTMSYHIFIKSGLLARLHLSISKFLNFMSAVEDGYHPEHQFHNAEHASDVLHCIYYFSTIPNISPIFKDLDYLAMYLSACIHDYDHPGVNNKFITTIGDPLALLYNDRSVLENHHCSSALKLLYKPGCNFIERLDTEKKHELREAIIEMVLATDLSKHFSYLTSFKKKLLDTLTCNSRDDRLLLMQMLIKCCDVSNPTKCREIYKMWIDRVMSEFFSQGDREKQLNIPVSPFCNRDNANVYSCQKGFIDFVAAPIFEAVGEYINKYRCENITTGTTTKHHHKDTQNTTITTTTSNATNELSRRNSGTATDNDKLKVTSSSSTTEDIKSQSSKNSISSSLNNNNSTLIKHTKTHKKTCSLASITEYQNKINVILDGLKSNKEWIDSNAAKSESS